eukprot:m.19759 g.19759  ORF g.19759 m.19759 type:complete len:78 (-) comp8501_c0_seq2:2591-2824(-)
MDVTSPKGFLVHLEMKDQLEGERKQALPLDCSVCENTHTIKQKHNSYKFSVMAKQQKYPVSVFHSILTVSHDTPPMT